MKVGVIGTGAIGGYVAARLILAGHTVSVVDQGEQLQAVQDGGIRVIGSDGVELVESPAMACGSAAQLPPQDVLLLVVKAHQIASVAADIAAILTPDTIIVTLQNGIPWWYFQQHSGAWGERALPRLDPDGVIARHIPVAQVVGCVVYPACSVIAPGVIKHVEGSRFPVGELDGQFTPRLQRVAELFQSAGFKAPMLENIREEIWLKLWGNLSFNPVSALTHASLADIARFPASRALVAAMMREAEAIAQRLGIAFRVSLDRRIAGAEAVGAHKASMLQDVELGRSIELDAILGVVSDLGKITNMPTPTIDAVFACASLLATTLARMNASLRVEAIACAPGQ